MRLTISKNANVNYLAKIVDVNNFHPHPNVEVTRLKCTYVDGYNIIVGIDSEPGKYVYFPTNSTINPKFLSFANLYRHSERNANPEQTGMFDDNGRVKAIKLKGCLSEGFLIPFVQFNNWIVDSLNIGLDEVGSNLEFDSVEHNGKSFWVNKKYIIETRNRGYRNNNSKQKHVKRFNKIIDTQFRFHYDTCLLKKEPNAISTNDLIHISEKIHGTSVISAYVLCKKPINIAKRILNWISGKGFRPYEEVYDYVYASRTVVKNSNEAGSGYYGCDVWAEADKVIRPHLIKGMTIYGEIVGFLPTGKYIQKNYDYGCVPPEEGETYTPEKHFKVRVYRITLTNVDGVVHEFSTREVQQWCNTHGLIPVEELYYGLAGDLYSDLKQDVNGEPMYVPDWNMHFLEKLANDKNFYMEMKSPSCNNNVPHEGIVIKIDNMKSAAWKLKTFAFLNGEQKELDSGIENIEDNA